MTYLGKYIVYVPRYLDIQDETFNIDEEYKPRRKIAFLANVYPLITRKAREYQTRVLVWCLKAVQHLFTSTNRYSRIDLFRKNPSSTINISMSMCHRLT